MFVDSPAMNQQDKFIGIGLPLRNRADDALVALAAGIGYVVAKAEPATLHGRVKLVLVIGQILVEIEDATVQLTHVLNDRIGHKTLPDKSFQLALGYPLGILGIALASRKLLDEMRVGKPKCHVLAQLVPYRNPIHRRAFHGAFRDPMTKHVIAHLSELGGQCSIRFLENNGLVITHNTQKDGTVA